MSDLSNGSSFCKKRKLSDSPERNKRKQTFDIPSDPCLCVLCRKRMKDPHSILCGHTFCKKCLVKHLDINKDCPICKMTISEGADGIFPNHSIRQVIEMINQTMVEGNLTVSAKHCQDCMKHRSLNTGSPFCSFHKFVQKLDMNDDRDKERLKHLLVDKRDRTLALIKKRSDTIVRNLVRLFLMKNYKEAKSICSGYFSDVKLYQNHLNNTGKCDLIEKKNEADFLVNGEVPMSIDDDDGIHESDETILPNIPPLNMDPVEDTDDMTAQEQLERLNPYLNEIEKEFKATADDYGGNEEFSQKIYDIIQVRKSQTVGTLSYIDKPMGKSACIVSSIEVSPNNEYCAAAGVLRLVKIFDITNLVQNSVHDRYNPYLNSPSLILRNKNKISAISWSQFYIKSLLTADYEGNLVLWNISTKKAVMLFKTHEKRCWDVEFSRCEPNLFISAGDDATVRLWSIRDKNEISLIKADFNVCTAKFNPEKSNEFVYGCSDHKLYYYDMRNVSKPLHVLRGHDKAVNHCKFINANEFASASVDGKIKVWKFDEDTGKFNCNQSLEGHKNSKNFVGLSGRNRYLVCGSEDNSLYVYHKDFKFPICQHPFDGHMTEEYKFLRPEFTSGASSFVSTVCWQENSNFILAGNSAGLIRYVHLY